MSSIKILDTLTANQIAAGEVVERPSSVVKELLENAIDAGAGRIGVQLRSGGLQSIQVVDNGRGMLPADLVLAPLRHATSKISSADDLSRLHTLGFRGEALPSIAAVSRLTIRTRTAADPIGWQIRVAGGHLLPAEETGSPVGTLVLVEDLFFNTPARKKFLRSAAAELAQISDLMARMALSRPDIAFELREEERTLLKTPGQGDLSQAVYAVYSGQVARQMAAVDREGEIAVHGLVSRPELTRSSRQYYSFFINQRLVRSSELAAVLEDAYQTRIPARRYPLAVVHFTMAPDQFDVNVHPAKMEVKFHQPLQVRESFAQALQDLFQPAVAIPSFFPRQAATGPGQKTAGPPPDLIPSWPVPGVKTALGDPINALSENQPDERVPPITAASEGLIPLSPGEEVFSPVALGRETPAAPEIMTLTVAAENGTADQNSGSADFCQERMDFMAAEGSSRFSAFRIIGQLSGTYILAEGPEGLYIIDQHAAHERIRYEAISRSFADQPSAHELLAVPQTLELTAQQTIWLVEHILDLADLGFILEHFGDNTFLLRGTPLWNQGGNSGELLLTILDELATERGSFDRQRWAAEKLFSLACKSAVKGNSHLPAGEMSHLLQQLEASGNPYTCPHGRPVLIKLSREEIRKRFLRS